MTTEKSRPTVGSASQDPRFISALMTPGDAAAVHRARLAILRLLDESSFPATDLERVLLERTLVLDGGFPGGAMVSAARAGDRQTCKNMLCLLLAGAPPETTARSGNPTPAQRLLIDTAADRVMSVFRPAAGQRGSEQASLPQPKTTAD